MLESAVMVNESVTATTTNEAHAHGMANAPDIVVTTEPSHAAVTVGDTPPDATNIYLTNTDGGDQVCQVLMIAL